MRTLSIDRFLAANVPIQIFGSTGKTMQHQQIINPDNDSKISDRFVDPAPWYFRTLESWIELYTTHGLSIVEIREPIHPQTGKPAAIISIGVL